MRCLCFAVAIATIALVLCAFASPRYVVTDLGHLGLNGSDPHSVNEHGEVTGMSLVSSGEFRAFYWSTTSGMVDIIPPGEPGTRPTGWGNGINDSAQVVGYIRTNSGQPIRAFLWSASAGFEQ